MKAGDKNEQKKIAIISIISAIIVIVLSLGIILTYYSNSYIVTYDLNGGVMEDTETRVWFESEYELPSPTKDGFAFAGWFYGDTYFKSSGIWAYEENITLKAKWEIRDENGVVYRKTEDGYVVESYKGLAKDVIIIPEVYNDLPIVGMDENAFHNLKNSMSELKSGTLTVYAPSAVGAIGENAELDSSVKIKRYSYIDENQIVYFDNAEYLTVVGYVGKYEKSITIPEEYKEKPVRAIGDYAFFGASFDYDSWFVYVPTSVVEISDTASNNIKVVIKLFGETDENSLMYRDEGSYYTVVGYSGDFSKNIVIPVTYKDKPVKAIGDRAFYGIEDRISKQSNDFFRVLIPENVEKIGDGAFAKCGGIKVSLYYMKGESLREITNINSSRLYDWILKAIIGINNDNFIQVITQISPAFGWSEYSDAKYYVRLNANGGNVTIDGVRRTDITFVKDKEYALPTPEREGYTFDGWYYGDIPVEQQGKPWKYNTYVGLTAKWIEN